LLPERNRFHHQLAGLKAEALSRLVAYLEREHRVFPVMAVEIEFYLQGGQGSAYPQMLLALLDDLCLREKIAAHPAEEERGKGQYEIALKPLVDLQKLAETAWKLPLFIEQAMHKEGMMANFSAKPLADDFGNGLHWHIHLQNRAEKTLYWRSEEGSYSNELLWSLGGLLETMPEAMLLFAPFPQSYARFQRAKMNAPTTIAWGANNRTTALRLPNKPLDSKHMEHRVAGADADPWLCILAILAGVAFGLEHKTFPDDAVYGDASDKQYEKEPLPDYEEAIALFQQSTILPEYLGEELCGEFLRRVVYPDMY
jgi:glutamine synthetase